VRNQIEINMLSGPVLRAVQVGLVLVSYPAYLHWLGVGQYGLWLVLSTVLMVSQLGNLGITQALAKVVAEEYAAGHTLAIRQYATVATLALAGSGLAASLCIAVLRGPIAAALGLGGEDAALARALLPYCGLLSVYVFLSDAQTNVLAGLGRTDLVNVLQALSQAISVAVGILLLRSGGGVAGLLAAAIFARAVQHGLAWFLTVRLLGAPAFTMAPLSRDHLRRLADLCGGLFAGSLIGLLLNPFNRIVVARFAGLQAVPVYEIAYNGSLQIRSLFVTMSSAILPEVSRRAGDSQEVRRVARKAVRMILICAVPCYAAVFAAAGSLLRVWLHGAVQPGQPAAFRIMLAGSFLSLLGTVPYFSLLGLHRSRDVLASFLVQSAVNVACIAAAWLSAGSVGLTVVVGSTAAGMAASTLFLAAAYRRAMDSAPVFSLSLRVSAPSSPVSVTQKP